MEARRTHGPRRLLVLGGLIAGLIAARPAGAQTPEQKAGARAAATQGNEAFGQKRWAEALDLFTRAESLMHAPTHVLMIGRSHAALGHLVRAYEAFAALSHETLAPNAANAFKEAQAAAAKELKALEPRIPTLTVKVGDPAAKNVVITMDGEPWPAALVGIARPVDPGTHVLKARADGLVSGEKSIKLDEGAKASIVLEMKPAPDDGKGAIAPPAPPPPRTDVPAPPPPSKGMRVGGFVTLGLGIAGMGLGAVFAGLGFADRGKADDAYGACGPPCVNGTPQANEVKSLDSSANTKQTIGLVGLVAGGALAATGVTLLVVSAKGKSPSSTGFVIGPGSMSVKGSF